MKIQKQQSTLKIQKITLTVVLILIISRSLFAWVYPEHRDIAVLAIMNLSLENRTILNQMWAEARTGYESRLPESIIDNGHGYIDFPSWSAIAGDHSCSPENMLHNVLETEWIVDVSDIALSLKIKLAEAENHYQRINSLRDSDNKLQRADPEYASRAGSNNVHFLLPLPSVDTTPSEYAEACFSEGAESNALAAYSYFHLSALSKLMKLQNSELSKEFKSKIILSALADEAFGLHFLEDVFAAGHVAGTWGNASQRKGTHDYYNEYGLAVTTWDGKQIILMGDAYMRVQDAELAAVTVQMSLEQFIETAAGKIYPDFLDKEIIIDKPNNFNVCKMNKTPPGFVSASIEFLSPILVSTPKPGLATGLGSLPRFRSELGLFIGTSPSVRGVTYSSGFGIEQKTSGGTGSVEAAVRFGVGLEGVLNESGDGLVFLDIGWRVDGASSMRFGSEPNLEQGGAVTAAIPGRDAYTLRFRMPFWLIPGDLVFAVPLFFISPSTYSSMAVIAGNGGLIPWQSGIATPIGRFQFILGREIGVAFYGLGGKKDAILIPDQKEGTKLVQYQSTQLDFPLLEYRPFRTFSLDQSSSLIVQLNAGLDIPHSENLINPKDVSVPELKTIYYLSLRFAFDWRYYF